MRPATSSSAATLLAAALRRAAVVSGCSRTSPTTPRCASSPRSPRRGRRARQIASSGDGGRSRSTGSRRRDSRSTAAAGARALLARRATAAACSCRSATRRTGTETYGGGRYLLDTVKGADLGGEATGSCSTSTSPTTRPAATTRAGCARSRRRRTACAIAIRAGERMPAEAGGGTRTHDPGLQDQLLYQLSYSGVPNRTRRVLVAGPGARAGGSGSCA